MSKTISAFIAHAGTILVTVLAALQNTGVLHQGTTITLALDSVAGFLIACHVVGVHGLDAFLSWLDTRLHIVAVTTKAQADAAHASTQAAAAVNGLQSLASSLGVPTTVPKAPAPPA